MPQPKAGKTLPKTKVRWDLITLSDYDPAAQQWTTFWFPRRMVAWPLSAEGPDGWGPDNKAAWWPYFQQRHKIQNNYWVQGHMLNDNIHGPGIPMNLVPISGTLNSNMLGCVERLVKAEVKKGKVLYYEVEAHWEGATPLWATNIWKNEDVVKGVMGEQLSNIPKVFKGQIEAERAAHPKRKVSKFGIDNPFATGIFRPTLEMLHPMAMRAACGLRSDGGSLLWGEQFAPTRLSWKVGISTNWSTAATWSTNDHALVGLAVSPRSDEWNNNYPA